MNIVTGKQESVYDLIRSMSKAEKRNFKLYATRLSGNQEAKFISLFDCMDALDEYDETKILQRCPIKKEQLPNMKAHLYKQILVSIRLLDAQRTVPTSPASCTTRDCSGKAPRSSKKRKNRRCSTNSTHRLSKSSSFRKGSGR